MTIVQRTRHHLPHRPRVPLAAAIAAVALFTGGCGGSTPTPAATGSGAGPSQSDVSDAFKFSSCMRDHGVTNFPDPKTSNQNGEQSVILHLTPALTSSPQFKPATTACRGIMPAPSKADLLAQAQQQRAHTQDLLSFARCLRTHGVTGFPDPDAQGELSAQTVSAAGVDVHAPAVQAAARTCLPSANGGITAADLARAESSAP